MVFLPQPPGQLLIPTIPAIQLQPAAQVHTPIELTFCPIAAVSKFQPTSLQLLDFSKLQSFDLVQHQYQNFGVEFEAAIALRPSNPAFVNPAHPIGLMPLIDRQPLIIHLHQLPKLIGVSLRGASPITIKAYNDDLLQKKQIDSPQLSNNTTHTIQLSEGITQVEMRSNTPFLLHHLIFG